MRVFTVYYNLIQNLSVRHKTSDRAERQFTQILLSDGGQKKICRNKKDRGEKSRQEIWVGTMAQALNSPSYEAAKFKHIYLHWLKDVIVRNKFPEKENIKVQTRC